MTSKLNKTPLINDGIQSNAYLKDTQIDEQFLETKDFFFQICKSISSVLTSCILSQKRLREPVFNMFYTFVDTEYTPLHQQRKQSIDSNKSLIDRMTYSNMLDSVVHKTFRRQAYSTLSSFLDMLKRSESLKQVPRIAEL